jgi:outer membrane protein assembly factor BamD (BamD/ComL family)
MAARSSSSSASASLLFVVSLLGAIAPGCRSFGQSTADAKPPAADAAQAPAAQPPAGDAAAGGSEIVTDDPTKPPKTAFQKVTDAFRKTFVESDQGPEVENVVRDADGKWRIDPRSAHQVERQKSGMADAEKLFREEKYDAAAKAFKKIAKRYKDRPLEEEALFMQAESLFKANHLPSAQDTYAKLLTKYPTTRYLPQSVQRTYDIAYFWLEDSQLRSQGKPGKYNTVTQAVNLFDRTRPLFDTNGRAIEAIETIQTHDPLGPLTDDAVMMAGAHKFTNTDYVEAAGYYEQIVSDQPRSEHTPRAFVLGAQSFLRAYQGPKYDGAELKGAERMTKAALNRSQSLSSEQQVRLEQDLRVIQLEKAKREFNVAEEYKQLRRWQAAKISFARVIKDYPDTDWARRAEEEIRGLEEIMKTKDWWTRTTESARSWVPGRAKPAAEVGQPAAPPTGGDPTDPLGRPTGSNPGQIPFDADGADARAPGRAGRNAQ